MKIVVTSIFVQDQDEALKFYSDHTAETLLSKNKQLYVKPC